MNFNWPMFFAAKLNEKKITRTLFIFLYCFVSLRSSAVTSEVVKASAAAVAYNF